MYVNMNIVCVYIYIYSELKYSRRYNVEHNRKTKYFIIIFSIQTYLVYNIYIYIYICIYVYMYICVYIYIDCISYDVASEFVPRFLALSYVCIDEDCMSLYRVLWFESYKYIIQVCVGMYEHMY